MLGRRPHCAIRSIFCWKYDSCESCLSIRHGGFSERRMLARRDAPTKRYRGIGWLCIVLLPGTPAAWIAIRGQEATCCRVQGSGSEIFFTSKALKAPSDVGILGHGSKIRPKQLKVRAVFNDLHTCCLQNYPSFGMALSVTPDFPPISKNGARASHCPPERPVGVDSPLARDRDSRADFPLW
jgi:hypothetical protein